jgi:type IX secretion system PorP/SprF family membrane protein
MKKILSGLLLLICFTKVGAQQDAQFSQYMFNGIYINPAYAGYKEQLNMHAFYRNQWTGIEGAPQTMSVAIDAIANGGNVGLALQLSSDRLGAQKNQSIYANYAYRLPLNSDGSSRLAFGLGLGAVQNGIDGAMLNPNDLEPNQPLNMQSSIVPDARVGAYFSSDRFYVGVSADNLVSQYISADTYDFIPKPKPHYYLTAGTLLPLNETVQLKPSFLLKDDRGGPTSLDLNAFAIIAERIWIGGSYRTGIKLYDKSYLQRDLSKVNSAVAAIQLFPSNNFRIGYAHDFALGALQGYGGGTHEISFAYFFNLRTIRMGTPRYF